MTECLYPELQMKIDISLQRLAYLKKILAIANRTVAVTT